jgi:hypothetical protein
VDLLGDRFVDVEAADKTPSFSPEQLDCTEESKYSFNKVII